MEKITSLANKLLKICFCCLLILMILCGNVENGVIFCILSLLAIYIFCQKVKIKNFALFLFLVSLISKIIMLFFLKVPLRADYKLMYEATTDFLNGNLSFLNSTYFQFFGYQLAHVLYQAFILNIFNNILVLKILNVLYGTIINVLIYLILKKGAKEKVARFASLFYAISLYPIYLNSVLGNQQLSLMLILSGVYLLLTKKINWKFALLSGVLMALGNIERPEGIIYILCIVFYSFLTKKIKIKNLIIILGVYFCINSLASVAIIKAGLNDFGLKNNNPEWKFVTGLNFEDSGKYSTSDEKEYLLNREKEKEIIKQRLTDFKNLPGLFYKKIKIEWLYDDLSETFYAKSNNQFNDSLMKTVVNYIQIMNYFIIFLALIGNLKGEHSDIQKFFMLNVSAYFVIYLFIEVSARYYYNPQVAIIILSAPGITKLFTFIESKAKIYNLKWLE